MNNIRYGVVSAMLVFVMIFSGFGAAADTQITQPAASLKYQKSIELVTALGIMDNDEDGTFHENEFLSRGEFAHIIAVMCGLSAMGENASKWYAEVFGDDKNTTLIEAVEKHAERFVDVESESEFYGDITKIASLGIMMGTSADRFEPDKEVTLQEMAKTFDVILGYSDRARAAGGYPAGYLKIAFDIDLFRGVSKNPSEKPDKGETAKLIDNVLGTEVMKQVTVGDLDRYKTFKGQTFMTEVMDIGYMTGVMTKTPFTDLYGGAPAGKNCVGVDGSLFYFDEAAEYVIDFIGMKVEVYYALAEENEDKPAIRYARVRDNNTSLVIQAKDLEGFSGHSIRYRDGNSTKSVGISKSSTLIYNGCAKTEYGAEDFELENGTVTLLSLDGSDYDTVIIESYQSMYASVIDANKLLVYDAILGVGGNVLDLSGDSYKQRLYKADGTKASFSDIGVGMVLDVARNGDVLKVILSERQETGFTVSEVSEDSELMISDGENSYEFLESYTKSGYFKKPQAGESYTLCLNSFGQIVWAQQIQRSGKRAAILIATNKEKGLSDRLILKILTEEGDIKQINAAAAMNLYTEQRGEELLKGGEKQQTALNGYTGLIRYELDSDSCMKRVELPASAAAEAGNRLTEICHVTEGRYSSARMFDADIVMDTDTVIFNIDTTKTEEKDKYRIVANSIFTDGYTYDVTGYSVDSRSKLAKYVVANVKIDYASPVYASDKFYVVEKIANTVDKDGAYQQKLYGYEIGNNAAVKKAELYCENNIFDSAVDNIGGTQTYQLQKGDIVRCYSFDGKVTDARLIWRADAVNPLGEESRRGSLVGTSGLYNPNTDGVGLNTNPYTLTRNGVLSLYRGSKFYTEQMRIIDGYAYQLRDNVLTYTTQDLSRNQYDKENTDPRYVTENVKMPSNAALITLEGGKINVRDVSAKDVLTYLDAGHGCSRILVHGQSGRIQKLFVINGELGREE